MKISSLVMVAALAFAGTAFTGSIAFAATPKPVVHTQSMPVPTCDPSTGKCTMQNGCSGGPCKM